MNLLSQARSVYAGAKRRLLENWSGSAAGFRSPHTPSGTGSVRATDLNPYLFLSLLSPESYTMKSTQHNSFTG